MDIPDNIRLYVESYLKKLQSGEEIILQDLIEDFKKINPIIHSHSNDNQIDFNALKYSLSRLPQEIFSVTRVNLFQSYEDLDQLGLNITTKWKKTDSIARRRLTFINPAQNTLATIISSDSDIHDIINCLLSFKIEKQKIKDKQEFLNEEEKKQIISILGLNWLSKINNNFSGHISVKMYSQPKPLYQDNCHYWLEDLIYRSEVLNLINLPIYFVSSNAHSLTNIIGGFFSQKQSHIFDYMSSAEPDIYSQWLKIKSENKVERINDFLYYAAGIFLRNHPDFYDEKQRYEKELGIKTIKSFKAFQSNTQIIPVKSISTSLNKDQNLKFDSSLINQSDAFIINVQYPLGFAAYYLLTEILDTFKQIQSVYILGKAAILKGRVGDIQIPISVYDEVSKNHYSFKNVFNKITQLNSYISSIFFDQKALTVLGTFLENQNTIDNCLKNDVNVIEMESGPYLQALSQKYLSAVTTSNNFDYDLNQIPLEIGIINYASDNPLVQTLAEEKESLFGIEPEYLSSMAILQRIVDLEQKRLETPNQLK